MKIKKENIFIIEAYELSGAEKLLNTFLIHSKSVRFENKIEVK